MKISVSFLVLALLTVSLITVGSQQSFAQAAAPNITITITPDANNPNPALITTSTATDWLNNPGGFSSSVLIFQILVTNTGSTDATNLIIQPNVGSGLTLLPYNQFDSVNSSDLICNQDPNNSNLVDCILPTLAVGEKHNFQIYVLVTGSGPTTFGVTGDNFPSVASLPITVPTITSVSIVNPPVISLPDPNAVPPTITSATPTISGTADPGTTVTLYDGASTTPIGTTVTLSDGTWSFVPGTPLASGAHTVTATATSADGTTTSTPPNPFTTFTVISPPVINMPVSGSSITSATPTISGTADPGTTVTLYDGTKVLGTTVTLSDGTWSFVPGTPLASGAHTVTATATSGTVTSSKSNTDTFTIVSNTCDKSKGDDKDKANNDHKDKGKGDDKCKVDDDKDKGKGDDKDHHDKDKGKGDDKDHHKKDSPLHWTYLGHKHSHK